MKEIKCYECEAPFIAKTKENEQTSTSDYCEFSSQFLPFLGEIAGSTNVV